MAASLSGGKMRGECSALDESRNRKTLYTYIQGETPLMRKLLVFLLVMLIAVPFVPTALAQDDAVVERLEEYGANLPEGYGVIAVDALVDMVAEGDVFLLDVRQPEEYEAGFIPTSVSVPLRTLGQNLNVLPGLDANIVVICKGGFRAMIGGAGLQFLGYDNVMVLKGGYDAWIGEDYPVETEAVEATDFGMPDIDPVLVEAADDFFSNLPDGWGAVRADGLVDEISAGDVPILLDVRSEGEWNDVGYIQGAQHIWINEFMANMDQWPADKDANIVVYCASSYRGGIAYAMLTLMGYTNVRNLAGGINAWIAAGYPVEGGGEMMEDEDPVLARLEEYGANLPEGYGVIAVDALVDMVAEGDVFLLDVRQPEEYEAGFIPTSVSVPLRTLGQNLNVLPGLDANIVVICKGGFRAMIGGAGLQFLGYDNVMVLKGGYDAWIGEDYPVETEAVEATDFGMPDIDPVLVEAADDFFSNLPDGWGAVRADGLVDEISAGDVPILLDVRSEGEWNDVGYIQGAQHIWINEFMANMDQWPADKDANIVVYCASSYRGGIAYAMLTLMGYTNVRNLAGGINAWIAAGYPVEGGGS